LAHITALMRVPVMPGDEAADYLVTQAIAEYLASDEAANIDGLLYPSVQTGHDHSQNVVLFHKASRVRDRDRLLGTTVEFSGEDRKSYRVLERNPHQIGPTIRTTSGPEDARPLTLEIDIASLEVVIVRAVKFEKDTHKVKWDQAPSADGPTSVLY
jgi:RES domain